MSLPPSVLENKYEVVARIHEGGMGAIYKVYHKLLDEFRVIKVMHPQIRQDETMQERFLREARMATRLRHPNVAQVYDFMVDPDGNAFLVMELIEGKNLQEMLQALGRLPLWVGLDAAIQGLAALSFLHTSGVVHRDISPDNLMLTLDPRQRLLTKLIDLGIAKSVSSSQGLTEAGWFVGKLRYASPEHFGGEGVKATDRRSDIYSFGILLYEVLTGVYPIQGEGGPGIMAGHLSRPPRSFRESDPDGQLPEELRDAILRALAKRPEDRFQEAEDLERALRAVHETLARTPEDEKALALLKFSSVPRARLSTKEQAQRSFRPAQPRVEGEGTEALAPPGEEPVPAPEVTPGGTLIAVPPALDTPQAEVRVTPRGTLVAPPVETPPEPLPVEEAPPAAVIEPPRETAPEPAPESPEPAPAPARPAVIAEPVAAVAEPAPSPPATPAPGPAPVVDQEAPTPPSVRKPAAPARPRRRRWPAVLGTVVALSVAAVALLVLVQRQQVREPAVVPTPPSTAAPAPTATVQPAETEPEENAPAEQTPAASPGDATTDFIGEFKSLQTEMKAQAGSPGPAPTELRKRAVDLNRRAAAVGVPEVNGFYPSLYGAWALCEALPASTDLKAIQTWRLPSALGELERFGKLYSSTRAVRADPHVKQILAEISGCVGATVDRLLQPYTPTSAGGELMAAAYDSGQEASLRALLGAPFWAPLERLAAGGLVRLAATPTRAPTLEAMAAALRAANAPSTPTPEPTPNATPTPVPEPAGDLAEPVAISSPAPTRPVEASAQGRQPTGIVILRLSVDEGGTVTEVRLLKGMSPSHGFNEAAVNAVKAWRFQPATRKGKAVPAAKTVTIMPAQWK